MSFETGVDSISENSRYYTACRLLLEGRREWAILIAGELFRCGSLAGRQFALRLLAKLYPGTCPPPSSYQAFPAKVFDLATARLTKEHDARE